MAALIPDERCVILAREILLLYIKTHQAIYGTSDATYNVMEPHLNWIPLQESSSPEAWVYTKRDFRADSYSGPNSKLSSEQSSDIDTIIDKIIDNFTNIGWHHECLNFGDISRQLDSLSTFQICSETLGPTSKKLGSIGCKRNVR